MSPLPLLLSLLWLLLILLTPVIASLSLISLWLIESKNVILKYSNRSYQSIKKVPLSVGSYPSSFFKD